MPIQLILYSGLPTQAILDYKWASYGRALFVVLAACSAALAGSFSAFTYYSQALAGWQLWAWTAALALNLLPLVLQEAIQVRGSRRDVAAVPNSYDAAALHAMSRMPSLAPCLYVSTHADEWCHGGSCT
jgi:hypothetical protein